MKLLFTSIISLSLMTASGQEDPSSPTQSPTFTEPCYVCGEPTLFVDPSLSIDFGGSILMCGLVESYAQSGLVSPEVCASLQPLVLASCTCAPVPPPGLPQPPVAAPTARPVQPPSLLTNTDPPSLLAGPIVSAAPAPSTQAPFMANRSFLLLFFLRQVRFQMLLQILPQLQHHLLPTASIAMFAVVTLTLLLILISRSILRQRTFACVELEELGTNRLASALECDLFVQLVLESCNCTSNSAGGGLPTTAPTPSPVTGSPSLAPSKSTIESGGGGGSNGLYALSLFALIPFAVGAFAWQRRRAQQSKTEKDENADEQDNPMSGHEPSQHDNDDNNIVPLEPSKQQQTSSGLPRFKDQVRSVSRPRHAGDDDAPATDASAHLMDDDAAAADDEQLVLQAEAVATAASHLPNVKDQCRTVRQRRSDQNLMPVANAILIDDSFSRINTSSNTKTDMDESI